MPYLFNTPEDQQQMLEAIGASSIDELFEQVPDELRLKRPLELPPAMGEPEQLVLTDCELFRLAHRWWYDSPCDEAILNRTFGDYLVHATVPPWTRHYCRRVLVLAALSRLDPREFGVEGRSVRRLTGSEQRFASLVTLFAFFVYWLFFA